MDLVNETKLDSEIISWLAFAAQKVVEVDALAKALCGKKDEVHVSADNLSIGLTFGADRFKTAILSFFHIHTSC